MLPEYLTLRSIAFRAALVFPSAILPVAALCHEPHGCPMGYPDTPALAGHIEQLDIGAGKYTLEQIIDHGRQLFVTKFNICDGQGRPSATGAGKRRNPDEPAFIRTSAPDTNSCAGCHAEPRAGGSGEFIANAFVLAQTLDPVTPSVAGEFSNERNTLGMFGSGAIEALAVEMSFELQAQAAKLPDGDHVLRTKGVEFAVSISDGRVIASSGVDSDLVIKPFHQAGVVVSLREFSNNAFNHHHGMQSEERFDRNHTTGFDSDFDRDGVQRELTVGDVTAVTLFQAALGVPGRVIPEDPYQRAVVEKGEAIFGTIGCTSCHLPSLTLDTPIFTEPNPFNPDGNLSGAEELYSFDLTADGELPRLERTAGGRGVVRAYTDLKRHNLCDPISEPDAIRYLCNETLDQARPAQDGNPGREYFLTRKLWDVGNSAPYGHRGDLTTITEAILVHGGEARETRDRFTVLSQEDQAAIVSFLKTLQVLPNEPS